MSEQNDSLIQNAVALGLNDGKVANLQYGANLGVGLKTASLDASTPLVFTPTVFVVLHTPSMYAGNPIIGQTIKTVIETHATAVSGIDVTYSLETSETPIGHDGQQMQVPTQSKRAAVSPSFTFTEVTGNLIWKLFVQWLRDIQDPDTNASMARWVNPGGDNVQFMSSAYSMSMVGIQFDPSGLAENIVGAAFYSNMFPIDPGGSFGFERNIGQSKTMQRTVNFTGIVQHNDTTDALGIEIAKILQDAKVRYGGNRAPFHSSVEQALSSSGLAKEISDQLG